MSNFEFYSLPRKIELAASLAKWSIQAERSVLVIFGQKSLNSTESYDDTNLAVHLSLLIKKAKALDIPVIEIESIDAMQSMQRLGQYVADQFQVLIAGQIFAMSKQLIQHISSVANHLCILNDAILLDSRQQHIQWISKLSGDGLHHMNTDAILRLWRLSAPTAFVLSEKGILLAIAEHLEMDILEIDPYVDLRRYGLDYIAMVSLIGLWRANGAQINYEIFLKSCNLAGLISILRT